MKTLLHKKNLLLIIVTNCIIGLAAAQDNCSGAINLFPSSNAGCSTITTGTLIGATASDTVDCDGLKHIDVWYKFTATQTYHKIVLQNSPVIQNLNIQFFSSTGGSCSNLTSMGCIGNNLSGDSVAYKAYHLITGNTYFVKVFTNYDPNTGPFDICITSPPTPIFTQPNDSCDKATVLTPSPNADFVVTTAGTGSCAGATPSVLDCYSRQSDDVWYKFQATANNHKIIVKGSGFVSNSGLFEYYPDGCNTNPYYGVCIHDYAGDSLVYKMAGLTIGQWYYVKVATNAVNDADRQFTICITTPQVPVNDECGHTVLLPAYATWHPTLGTTVEASGHVNDYDCYGNKMNDVWYKFVATNSIHKIIVKDLAFVENGGHIEFFTGDCNSLQQKGCTNSYDADSTFYEATGLTTGNTYYFKVYAPSTSVYEGTFDVCVTGGTDPVTGCTYNVPYSGSVTITANSGNICDHNGDLDYDNNANGYTIIKPVNQGDWVKLTFSLFNIADNNDIVTIFEGEGTAGAILYQGSAVSSPLPSFTAHGPLTIAFTSDGNVTAPGFTAAITNISNPCNTAPVTLYVDSAINASGNGSTWATAYKTLSEALFIANNCSGVQQIHVRQGTYYPCNDDGTSTANRDSSFRILRNGIKIYGGFSLDYNGTIANPAFNPTILSGDIGILNDNSDNSHHVITVQPLSGTDIYLSTVIDGFIINDGNADGNDFNGIDGSGGGGLYLFGQPHECSPLINNCVFKNNMAGYRGGAVMVYGIGNFLGSANCNPTINRCKFEGNSSQYGGAISIGGYNQGGKANVHLSDCIFLNNFSSVEGGAIHITAASGKSSDTIRNCTFSGNSANNGGAMRIDLTGSPSSTQLLMNCLFVNNIASAGGGAISLVKTDEIAFINSTFYGNKTNGISDDVIQFDGSNSQPAFVKNCIFGNDLIEANQNKFIVSNSLINRVMPLGQNNISGDPLYISALDPDGADNTFNTKDDGLAIEPASPAFNSGTNNVITAYNDTLDILHKNRKYGPAVDMGAYEVYDDPVYTGPCPANHIMYVDGSKANSGNGSSWAQAYKTLSEALYIAGTCTIVDSILIAEGTYYPVNYDGSFSNNRFNFFRIFRNNLKLYGGYPAGGIGTRDPDLHPAILSGDYNKDDNGFANNDENCYHIMVVYPDSLAANAITAGNTVIDGFTFKGGNANRPFGDGVSTNIRGRQIIFVLGGALYNKSQYDSYAESSPLINNCTFTNNSGRNGGGAMYSTCGVGKTSPVLTNSLFKQNRGIAGALGGGAILIDAYPSTLNNTLHLQHCVFEDNNAGSDGLDNQALGGAVMGIYHSNVVADNTIFSNNKAGQGAAVVVQNIIAPNIPTFNNCLFNKNIASLSGSVYNGGFGNFNNCTFNNNTSTVTAASNDIFGNPGTNAEALKRYNITNCIFYIDTIFENNIGVLTTKYNVKNSLINQPAFDITGNHNMITGDPHFVDATDEDGPNNTFGDLDDGLRLSDISPCVNAGDITGFGPDFPVKDIKNEDRIFNNGAIDMGCYEFQGAMNSSISLSASYATVSRNVSNDPVVVINSNNELIAKMVNVNSNNSSFLNQYNVTQIVHPFPPAIYQPYLKFSYHISQENGSTALPPGNSLQVTVYFTQATFDDYNLNNGGDPDMPTGPADAIGIGNVRIWQYHGNVNPGCANMQDILPSCYDMGSEVIIPNPNQVIWNPGQLRWEVTFTVSSFSGFYITTKLNDPLPLTLISFDAIKKDDGVQLNWTTYQEINTSHFIVQRSSDGSIFTGIGRIAAKSTGGSNNYSITDANALIGVNYYRLQMIDKDGKITISPVIKIIFNPKNELRLVPNPATNFITLSGIENKGTIQIFAMDGKLVKQLPATANSVRIDISILSKGLYMMEYRAAERVENIKFFKQ